MSIGHLDPISRQILRAVLETTVDQLAIVGGTIARFAGGGGGDPLQAGSVAAVVVQQQQQLPPHPNVTEAPLEELLMSERKILQKKCNKANDGRAMALKRLAAETHYVQRVLEDTLEEASDFGSFSFLKESVSKSDDRHLERIKISETEKLIRHEINDLKSSIMDARDRSKRDLLSESLLIARLKDALLEARRLTKGEEEFVQDLEAVREHEKVKLMANEEKGLVERRDNLKRDLEHEQRVTVELESWLNDRRSHLRAQHKHWTEKLKSDLTQRDLDLQELTQARDLDLRRRAEAEKTLESSSTFVREEFERRERMRKAKERMQLEIKTAVKIQAWWRMIMVRRNLGPFKKRRAKGPVKGGGQQKKRF